METSITTVLGIKYGKMDMIQVLQQLNRLDLSTIKHENISKMVVLTSNGCANFQVLTTSANRPNFLIANK